MIGLFSRLLTRSPGEGGGATADAPAAAGSSAPDGASAGVPVAARRQSEALSYFIKDLWEENPVFRGLLGMCPTLAVTAAVKPALTMGLAATFVIVCSNALVSLMRNALTPHLRILMFTLTISVFVTIADLFLKAFMPEMSEVLGPYVPLIIVNCMIIARAESCASKKGVVISIFDGLGTGFGFTLAIIMLATIRELLADGAWFGFRILPDWWVPWTVMKLPAGAFLTLGFMLAVIIHLHARKQAKQAA
ncbi:MAG: electron transport complex subunit RsxE [Candidatus Eisenbacteria sp.]|nr:electron transport complex subunit RsxE [Candidatus Eisenbacteria bacterium]